jgi:low affinity Fe/Cu permease
MSKKTEIIEEVKTNNVITTEEKTKGAIETLRVQLQEHSQQAEHHRTMATKAQGALEVLLQLHPEKVQKEG